MKLDIRAFGRVTSPGSSEPALGWLSWPPQWLHFTTVYLRVKEVRMQHRSLQSFGKGE